MVPSDLRGRANRFDPRTLVGSCRNSGSQRRKTSGTARISLTSGALLNVDIFDAYPYRFTERVKNGGSYNAFSTKITFMITRDVLGVCTSFRNAFDGSSQCLRSIVATDAMFTIPDSPERLVNRKNCV